MPQFRFRVKDGQGRVRKGRLTATDIDTARKLVMETGSDLIDIALIDEPAVIKFVKPSRGVTQRADPYDLPETLREKLSRLSRRLPDPTVSLSVMFVVGIFWGIYSWRSETRGAKGLLPEPKYTVVNVTVEGRLKGPANLADAQVVLIFPAVPVQFAKTWSELEHPAPGRFRWQTEFKSVKAPEQCLVRASLKPGGRDVTSEPLSLDGRPLAVELSL